MQPWSQDERLNALEKQNFSYCLRYLLNYINNAMARKTYSKGVNSYKFLQK